jgi:bifunctional UDP-N-acetylglucosamine pyrophosphorylase/glucosamine-1-phosphate N-acetyltransferase
MQKKPVNVVILAAGKGTRMYSDLPKVLHPLAGRPILEHVLETARTLDSEKICIVYGHGGEIVPNTISDRTIAWAYQAEQKGTGHAMQQALAYLDDNATALMLLGDVPLIEEGTCRDVISHAEGGSLAVLTMDKPDPTGYGRIVRDVDGRILAIVEHKDANEQQRAIREVNTGIMAAPVERLQQWLQRLSNDNQQGEYYLTDIIEMAVNEGTAVTSVRVRHEHEAMGINSKPDLAQAERIIQRRQAEALLTKGVTLADPGRIDIRGALICGRDVSIDINCVFEGSVELGDGVEIGPNCIIRASNIAAGTIIHANSLIENAQIGDNSRIGPFARIRPGTVLERQAHIGNFVEVKNSRIGAGSKANHLSYIGDSDVGCEVNIGAGTITCNYDGVNKHRTVIRDRAFIGSDSQLVAPVEIGEGATIAAGSTITKNAPAGELTLSRGKQVTISGWKRPEMKK